MVDLREAGVRLVRELFAGSEEAEADTFLRPACRISFVA